MTRGDNDCCVVLTIFGDCVEIYFRRTKPEILSAVRKRGTFYFVRDNGAGFDMAYVSSIGAFHACSRR